MWKSLETALPRVDMPVCGELGSLALPAGCSQVRLEPYLRVRPRRTGPRRRARPLGDGAGCGRCTRILPERKLHKGESFACVSGCNLAPRRTSGTY